jgi:chromosome segregation ATPase
MFRKIWRCSAALALSVLIATGCSSNRSEANQNAIQSMADLQEHLGDVKKTVDQTAVQLGQLRQQQGDLGSTFDAYSQSVSDLKSQSDAAAATAKSMQEKRKEYLQKWQDEVNSIQNPDIKASLDQRRQQVNAEYDSLSSSAQDLRDSFKQFLEDAQEIQSGLKIDLTPDGVKALSSAMSKTQDEGKAVSQKISDFSGKVAVLQGKISTPAPPPPNS